MAQSSAPTPTLVGKVAIVTGVSRGIGRAIALELARRGAKVSATYVSKNSTKSVDSLITDIANLQNGASYISIQADLSSQHGAAQVVQQTIAAFGPHIDIIVNNAAREPVKPISDMTSEDLDAIYHLNVRTPILVLQHALPHLRKPGRVINIGSVCARQGCRDLSLYCSSKAALEGLTRCWAREPGADGHTVNAVNPGPVQSDMLDNIPKDLVELQKRLTPIENRLGTVDDVAQIVAWLASEESRWITGQSISVSGGYDMH